ncbi:MAG: ATP-dependent Clp protease proteolytic subunit [Leptonema sp. (in: Bacteria)]|nr:ATP-dependent Clp protease proteolytic subunit [Leptonema sp. (in: bacteria)]
MQEFLTNIHPTARDLEEMMQEFAPTKAAIEKNFIEKRYIYLWGAVEDSSARYIVERLLYLESISPKTDITLFINSPGGVITSGMCIYDTMQMISSDVSTVCMGMAASMGALLLCGGQKGKRYAWPHSRIMIHQPLISGQIVAPAVDIKIHAQEIKKTRDELNRIIAEASGRTIEQVEKDTDRDNYMNTQEAIEYGLIDAAFPGY